MSLCLGSTGASGVPPQCLRASVPTAGPGAMPGTGSVFQAPQEGGPGQHGAVPVADTPTAAGAGTPQLCRGDGGSPGGAGWPAQGTPRGAQHRCSGGPAKPGIPPQRPPPPAVSPVAPIGVNHWDERWTAHLAPLVSSQEPKADHPDCTDGEVAAAPPATVAPRKPTFLQRERWSEGKMEGGPESPAQGHVAAGNRTGVGHPQVHRQELSGGRRSSRMEAADGPQSVDIGYHGSVTE